MKRDTFKAGDTIDAIAEANGFRLPETICAHGVEVELELAELLRPAGQVRMVLVGAGVAMSHAFAPCTPSMLSPRARCRARASRHRR